MRLSCSFYRERLLCNSKASEMVKNKTQTAMISLCVPILVNFYFRMLGNTHFSKLTVTIFNNYLFINAVCYIFNKSGQRTIILDLEIIL